MEGLFTILLLALYITPLILLWWGIRRFRQWRIKRSQEIQRRIEKRPSPIAAGQPVESEGMGYSYPLGIPLVIDPLILLGIYKGLGKWWGYLFHAVYFGLIGLFLWEALSRKEYEKTQAAHPTLNRITWMLNWLLFFIFLPLLAWLFFGLPVLLDSISN